MKHFITCINNPQAEYSESISLTTLFGRNTSKKISTPATNQPTDTNHTMMEHFLLTAVTIGLISLAIYSVCLGNKLVAEDNQTSTSIDRQGNGHWDSLFGSWKSGNGISADLERNLDEKNSRKP